MGTSGKVTMAQSLLGPSGGVQKVAITVFTKTPAEHLEFGGEEVADGLWTRAI